jgi:hypothetical protein
MCVDHLRLTVLVVRPSWKVFHLRTFDLYRMTWKYGYSFVRQSSRREELSRAVAGQHAGPLGLGQAGATLDFIVLASCALRPTEP